jgi:four helix bundle protein
MRRAAVSVAANIAEGCCRGGNRTLAQYLRMSAGSAGELEYYALLAADLKFIPKNEVVQFAEKVTEAKRIITGLLKVVAQNKTDN